MGGAHDERVAKEPLGFRGSAERAQHGTEVRRVLRRRRLERSRSLEEVEREVEVAEPMLDCPHQRQRLWMLGPRVQNTTQENACFLHGAGADLHQTGAYAFVRLAPRHPFRWCASFIYD